MISTVPVIAPVVFAAGFDGVWFGVMLVVLMQAGMILPPVGINLFVIQSIAKVPLATVVRGISPFVAADTIRLVIIALVPALATWLPGRMAG
jgi:TRAP-type C4-dicarboxylate transport system permease large subunit